MLEAEKGTKLVRKPCLLGGAGEVDALGDDVDGVRGVVVGRLLGVRVQVLVVRHPAPGPHAGCPPRHILSFTRVDFPQVDL